MRVKGPSTWCEVFTMMKNTFQYRHCGFHTEAHNEITVNLSSNGYYRSHFPSHSLTPPYLKAGSGQVAGLPSGVVCTCHVAQKDSLQYNHLLNLNMFSF